MNILLFVLATLLLLPYSSDAIDSCHACKAALNISSCLSNNIFCNFRTHACFVNVSDNGGQLQYELGCKLQTELAVSMSALKFPVLCVKYCNDANYCINKTCFNAIDHCKSNPCLHGTCNNTATSFNCTCDKGYSGPTCGTDIDECTTANPCDPVNAVCINSATPGFQPNCTCRPGWTGTGTKASPCTDIDECATANPCDPKNAVCRNNATPGLQPNCTCKTGWTGTGLKASLCTDIDECATANPCDPKNGVCRNNATPGLQPNCTCKTGWTGTGTKASPCTDIDECATANPCDPKNAVCTNSATPGLQPNCTCKTGWTGTGTKASLCTDIDECATANPCDLKNAVCRNSATPGLQPNCTCKTGWTGTGTKASLCIDIDECATANPCDSINAICTNGTTPGVQPKCTCKPGWTGTGTKVSPCIDIDECASNPCLNGGKCINGANKYTCKCVGGWAGPRCQYGFQTSMCSCTGDPHCTTLDQQLIGGRYYNFYKIGEFTMYKSKTFEVQVRTWKCWKVTCQCAVAMREGNDVVILDMCHGTWGHTFLKPDEKISQGTTVKNDSTGNTWTVSFPSGAEVKVVNGGGKYLNVYIKSPKADYKATQGLCGTFDGKTDNDHTRKDGVVEPWSSVPDAFVESWRIPNKKSMFDVAIKPPKPGRSALYPVAQGSGSNGRNRRQATTLDATTPLQYTYDYGLSWNPVIPDFPTKSGRTKADAERTCKTAFNKVSTINECVTKAGMNISAYLDMCVEDIKVSDEEFCVSSAVENAIESCIEVVLKNPSFYDNATNLLPSFITTDLCSSKCYDHGLCVQGVCKCDTGFVGVSCEIDANKPPSLFSIVSTNGFTPDSDVCDVKVKPCKTIDVVGNNMLKSNNMRCRLEELMFDGSGYIATGRNHTVATEFQTMYNVGCKMPPITAVDGRTVVGYNIYLTNDGVHYSNKQQVIIMDSTCMTCPKSGGNCQVKQNTCLINGNCRSAREVNPSVQSQLCDPSMSGNSWTDGFTNDTHHIAPLGGAVPHEFDIWTTSKTGCACASNASISECACCDAGACQCPGNNHSQCVQCGHLENCGNPLSRPDNGVDGYTLWFNDCKCSFNTTRSDCACWQNGGCQCGNAHQNQCVDCMHMDQCGCKPWIFGPAFPSN